MFRLGGRSDQGITSGLRKNLSNGGWETKVMPTKEEMERFSELLGPRGPDRSVSDFLINFGLNMAGNAPSGNIVQTAAKEAQAPFQKFQAQKMMREQSGRQETADLLGAVMGAKAEVLGGESAGSMYAKQVDAQEIRNNMEALSNLIMAQQGDNKLSDADYRKEKSILMQNLQKFTGGYPGVDALYKNTSQVELKIQGIQSRLINDPNPVKFIDENGEEQEMAASEYYTTNPDKLANKTQEIFLREYNNALLEAMGLPTAKAKGGRVGYQAGNLVDEQLTEVEETPQGIRAFSENIEEEVPASNELSFEELRGRLPPEVTDDIINLIVQSPSALVDFAEIQTQTDVDSFNAKYGVNLVLPSEA
jgi:hypothetical protein